MFTEFDQTVMAFGLLGDAPTAASFAELTLPEDELDALLDAEPGSDFNFSTEEFAALARVSGTNEAGAVAKRRSEIMQTLRSLLAARVIAYQARGLEGLTLYDRGDGDSVDPKADLVHAMPKLDGLPDELVGYRHALVEFPGGHSPNVEHQFLWILQEFNDRPAVVLTHRLYTKTETGMFAIQRNYYVGHTFAALQISVGAFVLGDDSLLFYTNRTYTEQVAGFGSSVAHSIGRKMMSDEVEDALRNSIELLKKKY
jgi:hypothetical protein